MHNYPLDSEPTKNKETETDCTVLTTLNEENFEIWNVPKINKSHK